MTEIQPYEAPTPALATTDTWVPILADVGDLASKIAGTDFVPKALQAKPAAVAAAILYGREVGLPPMTALKSINVIHGTPSLSAEAMRALILAAGHEIEFDEATATRCKMRGRRRGQENWTPASYTIDEAKQSGDFNKNPNYKSRPTEMLIARATSRLKSMIFADVTNGLQAPEDIDPDDTPTPPPAKVTVTQQDKPKPAPRKKATPKAAPPMAATPAQAAKFAAEAAPADDGPPLPGEDGFEDMVPEPPVEAPDDDKPTAQMVKALHSALTAAGLTSRADKLQFCGDVVGRSVQSSKELSRSEVADCLDTLSAPAEDEPIEAEFVD